MFGEDIRLLRTSHPNVRIALVIYFFSCLAGSIWGQTFLSAYLLEKTGGSNVAVGAIEAASGVAELVIALPMGYLADKVGKAHITKIGVTFGLISPCLIATAIMLQVSASRALMIFTAGMVIGGIQDGLLWGPVGALFADSVRSGQRSRSYFLSQVVVNIASMAGPAITIAYFSLSRNEWHIRQIESIIIVGLTMYLPMTFASYFLREADADGDALKRRRQKVSDGGSTTEEINEKTPLLTAPEVEKNEKDMDTPATHMSSSSTKADVGRDRKLHSYAWLIPYIIFVGDLVNQLGSGMTLKFLPLWWKEDVHLSPAGVQAIYLVEPIVVIVASWCAVRLSKRIGRVVVCMGSVALAAGALASIVLLYDQKAPLSALVVVYLLRSAFKVRSAI